MARYDQIGLRALVQPSPMLVSRIAIGEHVPARDSQEGGFDRSALDPIANACLLPYINDVPVKSPIDRYRNLSGQIYLHLTAGDVVTLRNVCDFPITLVAIPGEDYPDENAGLSIQDASVPASPGVEPEPWSGIDIFGSLEATLDGQTVAAGAAVQFHRVRVAKFQHMNFVPPMPPYTGLVPRVSGGVQLGWYGYAIKTSDYVRHRFPISTARPEVSRPISTPAYFTPLSTSVNQAPIIAVSAPNVPQYRVPISNTLPRSRTLVGTWPGRPIG